MSKRHPANAPGDWFVDTRCTNCGAARHVATGLIVEPDARMQKAKTGNVVFKVTALPPARTNT